MTHAYNESASFDCLDQGTKRSLVTVYKCFKAHVSSQLQVLWPLLYQDWRLTKPLWHYGLPVTLSVPFWKNSSSRGKLWRHFVGIRVMAIQPFVFWGGVHQKGINFQGIILSLGSKASDVFGFTSLLLIILVLKVSSLHYAKGALYSQNW